MIPGARLPFKVAFFATITLVLVLRFMQVTA